MIYLTFKTDLAKASEIKDFFNATEICDDKHPYDFFDVEYQKVHIHAYKNKKEIYTITFSGKGNEVKELAHNFTKEYTIKEYDDEKPVLSKNKSEGWEDFNYQIGSDEVGKGDFFGPLVVVASYVDSKDIEFLKQLKIDDSKKMNDDYILEIGATLKRRIKNYVVCISADKVSSLYEKKFNMDKILSLCHNLAQKGLLEKYNLPEHIIVYIDQFLGEDNYRKYVSDDIIKNPLYFRTKAESYYPSVAASSVIARYTFLKEWKNMEEKFQVTIPKGASAYVDTIFGQLKNKYGIEALNPYVKRFFNNYKKHL